MRKKSPVKKQRQTIHHKDPKGFRDKKLTMITVTDTENKIGESGSSGQISNLTMEIKHFDRTFENICIFGRKTFQDMVEVLGTPPEGRTYIVLSKNKETNFNLDGVFVVNSDREAIEKAYALQKPGQRIFICGGEKIYKLFLQHADKIIQTVVHKKIEGTAEFPLLEDDWFVEQKSEKKITRSGVVFETLSYSTIKKRL